MPDTLEAAIFEGIPTTSAGRWIGISRDAQQRVHAEALETLAAALVANGAFMALARADEPFVGDDPQGSREPTTAVALARLPPDEQARYLAQREVALLLAAWACVHAPRWAFARAALAFAAAELFDFDPWFAPVDPAAARAGLAPVDARAIADGRTLYARHGGALRAFLAVLYARTQDWLGLHGIASALLWRGLARSSETGLTRGPLQLQPLSSFTPRSKVARGFAGQGPGLLIAAEIPAPRILATARQGFGLLMSGVVVVLPFSEPAWTLAWSDGTDRAATDGGALRRLVGAELGLDAWR